MVIRVFTRPVSMRCWLTRPCIRWLRYILMMIGLLLLFAHGLMKISRGNGGSAVYSMEFDNVINLDEEESEKRLDVLQKRFIAQDELSRLNGDDYDDVIGIPLRKVHAAEGDDSKQLDAVNKDMQQVQATTMSSAVRKWLVSGVNEDAPGNVTGVNIIINSYGVRKPTVLDELFVDQREAMIFYQPSLHLRSYWYLRGDSQLCSMKSPSCILAAKDTSLLVLKCFIGLFQCSTEALATCVAPLGVVTHPDVAKYNECKKKANTAKDGETCLLMLRSMCTSAKVKVISLRSVTLDILEQMLTYVTNIKIIHVVRDLRSVIYSDKLKPATYLNISGDSFFKRAESLCQRTKYDLDIGKRIQKREGSTDRFQMLAQESILNDTVSGHVDLSNMFNMKVTKERSVYDVIKSGVLKIISKHAHIDKLWRLNMDISAITVGYNICKNLYETLGYRLV